MLLGIKSIFDAAVSCNMQSVRYFLESGVDVNSVDKDGWTCLHFAAFNANFELVEELLKWGANPNVVNKRGQRPLHLLRIDQNSTAITQALLAKGAEVNAVDSDHLTALYVAVQQNHAANTSLLLNSGANPEIMPNYFRPDMLMWAVRQDYAPIVSALLKAGADVNMVVNGETPLFVAAINNHLAMTKLLLQNGANPNARVFHDCSIVGFLSLGQHNSIIIALINAGASLETIPSPYYKSWLENSLQQNMNWLLLNLIARKRTFTLLAADIPLFLKTFKHCLKVFPELLNAPDITPIKVQYLRRRMRDFSEIAKKNHLLLDEVLEESERTILASFDSQAELQPSLFKLLMGTRAIQEHLLTMDEPSSSNEVATAGLSAPTLLVASAKRVTREPEQAPSAKRPRTTINSIRADRC